MTITPRMTTARSAPGLPAGQMPRATPRTPEPAVTEPTVTEPAVTEPAGGPAGPVTNGAAWSRPASSGVRKAKDLLATALVWLAFGIAVLPLLSILGTVVGAGWRPLLSAAWWTTDQTGALPPGFDHEVRGALHAIVGTVAMSLLTSVIAIPIAVLTAVYLVEYGRGPLARAVSFVVDILSGVPSIVAALFVFAVWVSFLGLRLIPACASFALVLLMVPVVTRSTEEMLRLVPNELREASYALGVPKGKTIVRVVLPTARSGIVTGAILGFARVAGETAPLLILAAYTGFFNPDLFSGTMAALPSLINSSYQQMGDPILAQRVWAAALTLILLVLSLNLIARLVARLIRVRER